MTIGQSTAHADELVKDSKTGCQLEIVSKFMDAASWQGPCIQGKAEGKGVARYFKAGQLFSTFRGTLRNGAKHGQGTDEYPSGAKYVGEFANNERNGMGTLTYLDGSVYVGGWMNTRRHGFGTLYDAKGAVVYQGEWIHHERADNSASGRGQQTATAGSGTSIVSSGAAKPREYSIENLYTDLWQALNAVKEDPFDPGKAKREKSDIMAKFAEREFIIPPAPAATGMIGATQGIWPLTYENGSLSFYLRQKPWPDTDDLDGALKYLSHYDKGRRRDIRTSDGNVCESYLDYRMFAIYPTPARSAGPMWMPIAPDGDRNMKTGDIFMSAPMSPDEARALSGKLATYVKMDSIDGLDSREVHPGGFRYSGSSCWAGTTWYISGRVSTIKVVNKESGQEIVSIKFLSWK